MRSITFVGINASVNVTSNVEDGRTLGILTQKIMCQISHHGSQLDVRIVCAPQSPCALWLYNSISEFHRQELLLFDKVMSEPRGCRNTFHQNPQQGCSHPSPRVSHRQVHNTTRLQLRHHAEIKEYKALQQNNQAPKVFLNQSCRIPRNVDYCSTDLLFPVVCLYKDPSRVIAIHV